MKIFRNFLIVLVFLTLGGCDQPPRGLSKGVDALNAKNFPVALKEFNRFANAPTERGFQLQAEYYLGLMYQNGQGVPQDYQQAVSWYKKASEQSAWERNQESGCNYSEKGCDKNLYSGSAEAQSSLGQMYYEGKAIPQDFLQARNWLMKSANNHSIDLKTHLILSEMYSKGLGGPADNSSAKYHYRKVAEVGANKGIAEDQFQLGMILNGYGNPGADSSHFIDEARTWFLKAAEQGHSGAQFDLGTMYKNGRGVSQNYKSAFEWYQKSANAGNPKAQFNLAAMYDNGLGLPQDYQQAINWYRRAAYQNIPEAQFTLGVMSATGRGMPQNELQAIIWYQKAADQGLIEAQLNLGILLVKRALDRSNLIQAHKWFNLAASKGNEAATGKRKIIEGLMRTEEISEAQELARNWLKRSQLSAVNAP